MITKRHCTKDGRHPEDVIYQERQFIREINEIVNSKFEKLVKYLGLDEAGSDWLFDYIYNCDDETISFDEFLNEAGLEYTEFVKTVGASSDEVMAAVDRIRNENLVS